MSLEAWLVTDVGVVREHNEDSAYMDSDKGFFIVADGMGGHAAGEVASAMAVETVKKTLEAAGGEIDAFKRAPTDAGRRQIVQLLQSAVLSAHQAVFQRGQTEPDKAGMGTTLDVVLVAGPEAFVAHVGDSRTYLVREGRSSQITTDHTVAEVLVIEGKLTIEEAQVSPLRTILVNAIGVSADVGVEMAHVTLKRGDRLLLCSDGLHDYFPLEEEIAQKMSGEQPGDALAEMVELAKTRGGHDNITGVAVFVAEVDEGVPSQVEAESTQPVDLANPFATDEPTETAFLSQVPSRPASAMRPTQPLRAVAPSVDDAMHADTIPPPTVRDALARMPTDPPDDEKAEPDKAEPDKAEPEEAAPAEAAAKPEKKPRKRKPKKTEGKADEAKPEAEAAAPADADEGDKDGAADERAAKPDAEGAPTEIATADTGRVVAPKASDSDAS